MAKLVELGHLQPTDLLWRDGFPGLAAGHGGVPAARSGPAARVRARAPGAGLPHARGRAAGRSGSRRTRSARGQRWRIGARPRHRARAVAVLLLVALLAGAGGAGYVYRDQLPGYEQLAGIVASLTASLSASSGAMDIADRKSLETPPLVGFRAGSVDAIDATLQNTALWRVIKREFPDWYTERLERGGDACARQQGRRGDRPAGGPQAGRAAPAAGRQRTVRQAADAQDGGQRVLRHTDQAAQIQPRGLQRLHQARRGGAVDRRPPAGLRSHRASAGAGDGGVRGDRRRAPGAARASAAEPGRSTRCWPTSSPSAAGRRRTSSC